VQTSHSPKQHSAATSETLTDFQRAVSSSFVPLRVSNGTAPHFHARLTSAGSDSIEFTEVHADPHLVERTKENIDLGGTGYYKVSLLLEGTSVLVQDGRELVMHSGDLTVYDTSRPYSLLFTEQFRNIIMMFPKERLGLPVPFTEQLSAVSLSEDRSLAPIVSAFISQFPGQLADLTTPIRSKICQTSLALVSTLFSEVLDVQAHAKDPRQAMLQQIYAFIDAHLSNPDLSPGSIAQAHYISTRHLHALFAELDTTVSTVIRQRRLEGARRDLADPILASLTVAAVATRWGFVDAAHFSRVFKRTYGHSPSELRQH
jgi:AraC-like DNA-binding protein